MPNAHIPAQAPRFFMGHLMFPGRVLFAGCAGVVGRRVLWVESTSGRQVSNGASGQEPAALPPSVPPSRPSVGGSSVVGLTVASPSPGSGCSWLYESRPGCVCCVRERVSQRARAGSALPPADRRHGGRPHAHRGRGRALLQCRRRARPQRRPGQTQPGEVWTQRYVTHQQLRRGWGGGGE